MLSATIIDDEQDSIDVLSTLIQRLDKNINIVGTGNTIDEALDIIKRYNPDILFLDVRLGDRLSFELFDLIPEYAHQVIFISAYDQYAVKAFKYSAVDFLLKPIDFEDLEEAISKVKKRIEGNQLIYTNLKALFENFSAPRPFMLSVPTSDGVEFVNIEEILEIKAEGSYSVLNFQNNFKMMVSKNIGEFQEQLPKEAFCRVHNSYIINLKHIKKLKRKGGLAAEMPNGKVIPIARNRKDNFMQLMDNFLIQK